MKRAAVFLLLGSVLNPVVVILMMIKIGHYWIHEYAAILAILLFLFLLPMTVLGWFLDEFMSDDFTFTILPRAILVAILAGIAAWAWAFLVRSWTPDWLYFSVG